MTDAPLWVFGYGSLMWDPGFEYCDKQIARLHGYHRAFCMHSIHYRGTAENPGLVLALDQLKGTHCDGLAFQVAPQKAADVMDYLRERELVSEAYLEIQHPVELRSGAHVQAVTYVIDAHHAQYCGGLTLEQQASIIAHAHGARGPNADYLHNTAAHLHELGISDDELDWLSGRVRALV